MTLQIAQPGDFERINALFVEMLRSIYPAQPVEGYAAGALDRYFSGGADRIFTVPAEGEIIAFLSVEVHREDGGFLYLDDFSVTEKYRCRGIGTALLHHAAAYAQELQLPALRLHVESSNLAALRLYQRLGFELEEKQGERLLLRREP